MAAAQAQVETARGDANALRGEAEKWRAEAQVRVSNIALHVVIVAAATALECVVLCCNSK